MSSWYPQKETSGTGLLILFPCSFCTTLCSAPLPNKYSILEREPSSNNDSAWFFINWHSLQPFFFLIQGSLVLLVNSCTSHQNFITVFPLSLDILARFLMQPAATVYLSFSVITFPFPVTFMCWSMTIKKKNNIQSTHKGQKRNFPVKQRHKESTAIHSLILLWG